uniref:C-type lectin domain-containing protein n=1 Tax=Pygocentrus nattereri TaxID=42514 RepID=A0AAR2JT06_PYGNA
MFIKILLTIISALLIVSFINPDLTLKYHLISENKSCWEDALGYCQDNGIGLLRIQSESDQKEVEFELRRRNVSGMLWVGLGQSQLFGFWMWTGGIGVGNWTNWAGGRQPEPPLSHHCGAIDTEKVLCQDCTALSVYCV